MRKVSAVDLLFLLLENPSRPTHMAAYQLFRLPPGAKEDFVPRLVETLRNSKTSAPFNLRLKWLSRSLASWEEVTPDMTYHVRHLAVPKPGRLSDLHEIVTFLNQPLLDRAKPLWECYVIDGIEDDQFAVYYKIHHALIDGQTGLRLFRESLSTNAGDDEIRPVWAAGKPGSTKRATGGRQSTLQQLTNVVGSLPKNLIDVTTGFADLGAQTLGLKTREATTLFRAPKTLYNRTAQSSARRYAQCEMPLESIRSIANSTATTVNDVVMTVIDDGLHRYLEEQGAGIDKPLVAIMAMSLRNEKNREASGNQAAVDLVSMGQARAGITDRLAQLHESTSAVKRKGSRLPPSVRQLYSLLVFGASTLPDVSQAFQKFPNVNLVISNMAGPAEQLYLGGAPQVAFHGLPIVPPGCGLNVTFVSVNQAICLAVGAAPEAVSDAERLIELILDAFQRLEQATITRPARRSRKTAAKPAAAAAKKTTRKKNAKKPALRKKALKKKPLK